MTDRSPPMKPEMIEAAAEAIYNLFTYDEPGEKPTWVERGNSFKQEDARRYAAAALSVPAAAVVGEPVGYLFEMHYGNGRWSGTIFAEAINIPPEDVRNVRPLYDALGGASHD